jgi:hypothetical protein
MAVAKELLVSRRRKKLKRASEGDEVPTQGFYPDDFPFLPSMFSHVGHLHGTFHRRE